MSDCETTPDDPSALPAESVPPNSRGLYETLLYGLSLPERSLRGVSAVVGGMVHESATRLLPTAFRTSKSYSTFIQQSLNMLMHDFGGVRSNLPQEATTDEEAFLARKAVGGLLDFAALATLHLSPMTALAVFSDLAYGSGEYIRQVGDELKKQGVIAEESTINHVSDLLQAVREASGTAADSLDRPPIDLAALERSVSTTRASLAKVDLGNLIPQAEIKRLWQEMEEVATESDASIMDVSATASLLVLDKLHLAGKGALVGVTVAGNLLDQHLLQHYKTALTEIHQEGLYSTLAKSSAPYLDAVWGNFSEAKTTWTEELLSGRLPSQAWKWLRG